MLIEGIRDEHDTLKLGIFRISQVVALLCFVAGIALLIMLFMKYKNQKLETEAYEGVYTSAQGKLPVDSDSSDDETEIVEEVEKVEEVKAIEEINENTNDTIDTVDTVDTVEENENDGDE